MNQNVTSVVRGTLFNSFIYKHRTVVIHIITGLLILLFTYASVSKLVDLKRFTWQLNNQPFPDFWTPFLIWAIPGIELIISAALMFERTRRIGMWASFALMTTFTIYVLLAVLKIFERVPCSCGGVLEKMGWAMHLYFNIFFTLLSLAGIFLMNRRKI